MDEHRAAVQCVEGLSGRIAPTGLPLRKGMSFDAWLQVGRHIAEITNASAWWLGDWLVFGQQTYSGRYRTAIRATSLDYQTLRNYAWVARRFQPSRRRDTLSLQHHAEVAALSDAEQDLWLCRAERLGWSRNQLRRQLASQRRIPETVDARVTLRVEVAADRRQRWREAAAMADQPLGDWMTAAADVAADAALFADHSIESVSPTMPRSVEARSLQPGAVAR
jgi:hypothetical protein